MPSALWTPMLFSFIINFFTLDRFHLHHFVQRESRMNHDITYQKSNMWITNLVNFSHLLKLLNI